VDPLFVSHIEETRRSELTPSTLAVSTATHRLCSAPPSPTKCRADVLRCIYLQETSQIHEGWAALASAVTSIQLLGAPTAAGPLL
jgi:hypothetical protein